MDAEYLLREIDAAFPPFEMPSSLEFVSETPHYIESDEIRDDMEEFRGKKIDAKAIRTIHRYFPVLSPMATRWILPEYLRFCLTSEAQSHCRVETMSLIYALSPDAEFRNDTLTRLSMLNTKQRMCLIHFLQWCLLDEYWIDSDPERIRTGIDFLNQ